MQGHGGVGSVPRLCARPQADSGRDGAGPASRARSLVDKAVIALQCDERQSDGDARWTQVHLLRVDAVLSLAKVTCEQALLTLSWLSGEEMRFRKVK